MKYFPEQIDVQQIYALRVAIRDGGGSLIYEPQLPIPVVPMGDERTMFVDIAMKEVTSGVQRRRWPELLGMNGEEAVGVIKKETGLTNVLTLPDDAPVTLDYRTDRVRVFIDGKGLVSQMPYIA